MSFDKNNIRELFEGDCLEIMPEIPDGSIDLILADLPYGTTGCSWDEIISFKSLWDIYYKILRPNGFIVLTASQPFTSKLVMSNVDNFSHQWLWEKDQGVNFQLANKMPLKKFEDIIVFNKDFYDTEKNHPLRQYFLNEKKNSNLKNSDIKKLLGNGMGGHYFTSGIQFTIPTKVNYRKLQLTKYFKKPFDEIVKIDYDFRNKYKRVYNPQGLIPIERKKSNKGKGGNIGHLSSENKRDDYIQKFKNYPTEHLKFIRDRGLHPTQKPVALFEYLIKTYTNEGDIVLDNVAGSGTTGAACDNTNRQFILIEKEKKYCDIIRKRLNIE